MSKTPQQMYDLLSFFDGYILDYNRGRGDSQTSVFTPFCRDDLRPLDDRDIMPTERQFNFVLDRAAIGLDSDRFSPDEAVQKEAL